MKLATVKQSLKRGSGCECSRMERTREKDPRIKTFRDYGELAAQKGIKFLDSDIPEKTNLPATWGCQQCGVPFRQSYQLIQAGHTKCKTCTGKAPITIEQLRRLGQAQGYRLLTTALDQAGETEVHFVREQTGERFSGTAKAIKNGDKRWPTQRKKVQRHDSSYLKELVRSRGLELVDPNIIYENNTQELQVRCQKSNHEFPTNLRRLQDSNTPPFCTTCRLLERLE